MIDRSDDLSAETEGDSTLAELTEEITRRLQSGEVVDADAYAGTHPECSEPIRALLPTMHELVALGQSVARERQGRKRSEQIPPSARKKPSP